MSKTLELVMPGSARGRAFVFLHDGNTKKMVFTAPCTPRGKDLVYETVDRLKNLHQAEVFEWDGRLQERRKVYGRTG